MRHLLLAIAVLSTAIAAAQTPRRLMVEHFTNSRCSVCAGQNPGIFNALAQYPDAIHISYHPSSPYPSCIFSQHNVTDNNARTNYYNLFGATPRIALQGAALPIGNPVLTTTHLQNASGQTSPVEIVVTQQRIGADSVRVRAEWTTTGAHQLPSVTLYMGLAEDTIIYAAPNGENTHRHVFRKALLGANGTGVNVLPNVGGMLSMEAVYAIHPAWQEEKMFAYAILQQTNTKVLIQANRSLRLDQLMVGQNLIGQQPQFSARLFPNPAQDVVNIETDLAATGSVSYRVWDAQGKEVLQGTWAASADRRYRLSLQELNTGIYTIVLNQDEKASTPLQVVVNQ